MNGGDEVLVVTVRTAGTSAVEEYMMGSGSGEGQTAVAGRVVAIASRPTGRLDVAEGEWALRLKNLDMPPCRALHETAKR